MSVKCLTCDCEIAVKPKVPLRLINENGKQAIATDYSAVYEHIRDVHPDQWTDELAESYEQHMKS